MALPALVWVEISTPQELDRRLEILDAAKSAGGLLDPLDRGADRCQPGVSTLVRQIRQHVREKSPDQFSDIGYQPQPSVGGAPEPARKGLGGPR